MDMKECNASALTNLHIWLLLFADDLTQMSKSKVGLHQQLDMLQQLYDECDSTVNVKKTKVMVFNYVNPCQKFVFEGDTIERVQTFKYLEILLETTPNLNSVVECLIVVSRCSLFALYYCCAKLCIMDVKLCYDLFNTPMHSIANYAYEFWVDFKKIEVIKVVY